MSSSVAVVVLSWNRKQTTLACLRSLGDVTYEPLSIICVDNGSTDGSLDAVEAAFPSVNVVRLHKNHGFAGGMNRGIRAALANGAESILTLNNDMTVEPGFIGPLVEVLGHDPAAGAACSQILFADGSERIWYAGARWRARRGYQGRHLHYRESALPRATAAFVTDRACGGAMLAPRTAWERVGLLDEDLFAYGEDVDWSLRAREKGLQVLVVPASVVRHEVSASTGGESSPSTIYYGLRNGLAVAEKRAPLGFAGTHLRRLEALAANLAQAVLFSPRRLAALGAVYRGWRDLRKGRLGPMR